MDQNATNYFRKGRDNGPLLNFDLIPLIDGFDFYEFCDNGQKQTGDYGGFIVITDKQFIVGYNSGFGVGSHRDVFARVYRDIHGGGPINSELEAIEFERKLITSAIVGKIHFELTASLDVPSYYSGHIHFDLTVPGSKGQIKPITIKQFNNFKKFYEKYNKDIEYVCQKFDFKIILTYYDLFGALVTITSFSLDSLYTFMETHICSDFVYPELDTENVILEQKIKKL